MKRKVYRMYSSETSTTTRLYGLEAVALTKRQDAELEVAELKMLIFSLEVMRMDRISNEYIRGKAQVRRFGDKARER